MPFFVLKPSLPPLSWTSCGITASHNLAVCHLISDWPQINVLLWGNSKWPFSSCHSASFLSSPNHVSSLSRCIKLLISICLEAPGELELTRIALSLKQFLLKLSLKKKMNKASQYQFFRLELGTFA